MAGGRDARIMVSNTHRQGVVADVFRELNIRLEPAREAVIAVLAGDKSPARFTSAMAVVPQEQRYQILAWATWGDRNYLIVVGENGSPTMFDIACEDVPTAAIAVGKVLTISSNTPSITEATRKTTVSL